MHMNRLSNNEHGLTLIEVMVALGILAISLLLFTNFMNSQFVQQKRLAQKIELNDFQRVLTTLYANSNTCPCMFPSTLDSTSKTNLTQLKDSCDASVPPLITINNDLPNSDTGVKIKDIAIDKVVPIGANLYKVELIVNPDHSTLVASLAPTRTTVVVSASGPDPANLSVDACGDNMDNDPSPSKFDIDQVCFYLGGSVDPTTKKCSIPYAAAAPAALPPGTVVARCDVSGIFQFTCSGGAGKKKVCPPGSVLSDLKQRGIWQYSFKCSIP